MPDHKLQPPISDAQEGDALVSVSQPGVPTPAFALARLPVVRLPTPTCQLTLGSAYAHNVPDLSSLHLAGGIPGKPGLRSRSMPAPGHFSGLEETCGHSVCSHFNQS